MRVRSSRRVADTGLRVLDHLVPASQGVVVHSSPDLDDNVVALLRHTPGDLSVVVLVDDLRDARRRARALGVDGHLVARRSPAGIWAYLRAAVAISTHGIFGTRRRPRGRRSIGLWHGEFGKLLGSYLDEAATHYDWMPVSSGLSRAWRSAEFGIPPRHVHVVGSPRQEFLVGNGSAEVSRRLGDGPHLVWAPTYRVDYLGRAHLDSGLTTVLDALPLDDQRLQRLLAHAGATLWMRPHPADVPTTAALRGAPATVRDASNRALEELGLTFYELLGVADVLVTDYSSLWIDYLLTERPMISFAPDLESYRRSRGLALEPHEVWFPGPVVGEVEHLLDAVRAALAGDDADRHRRADRRHLLHATPGDRASSAVWQFASDG